MTIYVMHREVCLKHRKNRRETILRVRTQVPSWQRCLFFFVVSGAGVTTRAAHLARPSTNPHFSPPPPRRSSSKSRMPECQSGDAGAIPADRTIFQIPTIKSHNVCGGRQLAQLGLQNLAGSGQHRDAVPLFQSRGSQVGRQRPHKSSMSGFDSRPRHQVHGPLDHSARSLASQAGEHGAKPWRSTFFKIAGRLRTRGVS